MTAIHVTTNAALRLHSTTGNAESKPKVSSRRANDDEWKRTVKGYYNSKTAALIDKYGPGPRVHYHLGLFESDPEPVLDVDSIRHRLVYSQEALMRRCADVWDAPNTMKGRVLDVGCGLGGGSIYWAQEFGAKVTAVTVAQEHIPFVQGFAEQAGVKAQVHPLLAEACEIPIGQRYDTAVALESSCYLDRKRWFQHLSRLLAPGAHVCIEDVFRKRTLSAAVGNSQLWNSYFHCKAGTVDEYTAYARAAGFELVVNADITFQTRAFWKVSRDWAEAKLTTVDLDSKTRERLEDSRRVHDQLYRNWMNCGVEVRLLRFRDTR